MTITPEILEIEKKLISLDSSLSYTSKDIEKLQDQIKALDINNDEIQDQVKIIAVKLQSLENNLRELKENPFLAFTAQLDIKKTVMIIIFVASVISSLSTLDFLVSKGNTDTQKDILDKLEKILETQ